jgi:pimeloyl-ACP methyl ester carboxylesterase
MSPMQYWFFCLVALPFLASAGDKSAAIVDDVAYEKPQRLVTIGSGQRLNIYCTGIGSPTVVFDSGLGEKTANWGLIQPAVTKRTRACSYDRAGLGFSDPPNRSSTSANMVDDLHRLLHAARIPPPFILVGHSLGGMNIKLYAETYLSEVSGLVFVDPSHEDLGKGAWKIDPESEKTYAPYMEALHRCLEAKPEDFVAGSELVKNCGPFQDSHYSATINTIEMERGRQHERMQARISEQENVWFTSADQVRAAYRPLGAIPIIVLTHEAFPRGPAETQEQRDAKNQLWLTLHEHIAAMSTRGNRITVEKSGHYIQFEQPQVVIDSIFKVLQESRRQ